MDEAASDYRHGQQDPTAQVASYRLFNALTKWVSLHLAVMVTVFTLWFCVGASFFAGLIPGVIIWGIGAYFLLRSKPGPEL